MGVSNLFKIKVDNPKSDYDGKTIGELGEEVRLKDLKNERVCVDASGMIYSAILAMAHINSLTDSEGNTTAHITTIFNKIFQLKNAGVKQIWIFDSPKPNKMKQKELKKRDKRRERYKHDEKVQFKMTGKHVQDIKTLLTHMGITYVEAPPGIEAEQYGAMLTAGSQDERFCQYMISGDSDVLAFGGNLLRITSKRSSTGKSKKTVYYKYDLSVILEETGLSYQQFLEMCVTMGTDFNEKTKRVGPKTVISKIKNQKIDLTDEQYEAIKYFKSNPEMDNSDMKASNYNKTEVIKFLVSKAFNKTLLEKRLAS